MFLLGFADSIQADREREIAELIRLRRLLKREPDDPATDQPTAKLRSDEPTDGRSRRVRARLARG